jgi:general L-amino acid transport system permease protein
MRPLSTAARQSRDGLNSVTKALFGTLANAAISLGMLILFAMVVPAFYRWAITTGTLSGADRKACVEGGACWIFLRLRFQDLIYGGYPEDQVWRVNAAGLLLAILIAGAFFKTNPWRQQFILLLCIAYPLVAAGLIAGGLPGLPRVETRLWGGFMLNLVLAVIVVVGAVPLGLLLAEARRAKDPTVRVLAIGFIELWRATPLVTVLFMGIFILPFALPPGFGLNKFLSVATALILFNSAYMAEAIRGGLQAVPIGQLQAAEALGLHHWQSRFLVVWPQAIRLSLPSIVNTAIDLFKDTSLVVIVGLFDVLGAVQQAVKDPKWLGLATEGYIFVASLFFVVCMTLSAMSKAIERELDPAHRNAAASDSQNDIAAH